MGGQRLRVRLSGAPAMSAVQMRALRDGAILAGLLFLAYLFLVVAPQAKTVGFDALSYYLYGIDNPYWLAHGTMGSFVYSPIAARLFQLDSLLPFWQFLWLWTALLVGTVLWLGGRRRWLWILAFPPVALELYHGNVHLLIAAAIALGFRYPVAWVFVLVTKVTPGVGLLWFAVRREWRSLGIALGATAIVAAVSFLFGPPGTWQQWLDVLTANATRPIDSGSLPIPLMVRLPLALVVIAWAAAGNRRWALPIGCLLALPVIWYGSLSLLVAIVPLVGIPGLRAYLWEPVAATA